ncbi:acetyl xylan esterase [Coprinopsis cinerea AmutBmut pab1-1]|nr:acetyl xylan esterase [Coprinopsis cinerea AmutBmut pab1-1]
MWAATLRGLLVVSGLVLLSNAQLTSISSKSFWYQCGGKGYTGATVCATPTEEGEGVTCSSLNEWYHQCIPTLHPGATHTPTWLPTITVPPPAPTITHL